eukprot:2658944-Prymnesium_polylepis.1
MQGSGMGEGGAARPGRAARRGALTRGRWRCHARGGPVCRGGARRRAPLPARTRCAGGGSGGRCSRVGRRPSRSAERCAPPPSPG